MSESGRDALPDVREWSGGPPGCPGVVGRPCQMSGSGRGPSRMSRRPAGCLEVVGRSSEMSVSGLEAAQDVREWS